MKKIFILVIISLLSIKAFSQSMYKNDVAPVIGEDYVGHTIDNPEVLNPGSGGIGQTWDLSNANFSLQNDYYYLIMDPASTPHSVPGASYAIKKYASWDTTYAGYEYFRDTTDRFYTLHEYGSVLDIAYSLYEFIWKFPLLYGDSVTSSFSFSTTAFSVTYNYTATSKLKLDGTGILLTGSTPFQNVIRLKYEQMSIRQSPNDTSYLTKYIWYLAGIHHPLAEYNTHLDPNGTTYYFASFYSTSNTTGIGNINSENDLQVYCDPANDYLNVKSTSGFEKIILRDINGRQNREENFPTQKNYLLNIEQLSPGVYFLSVNSGNRNLVRKFVKQ